MEVNQKSVNRKLKQANQIYNYLSTNKIRRQDEIYRNLKIDSRLVSWLAQNKIIYKHDDCYVWNSKLKPNAKMIETFQIYYLNRIKSYDEPQSSKNKKLSSASSVRVFSILWGLFKFEIKMK
jgi:hypothetical protein